MRRLILVALAAATLVAAKGAPPATLLLTPSNLDPALVLPPAAPRSGAAEGAELAQLHTVDRVRTNEEAAAAKAMGQVKSVATFAAVMGPRFDLDRMPATKALFETVRTEEKAASDRAKVVFRRDRPWMADPSLHPCSAKDEPGSSYPSGHASMAFAMADILARLAPAKAPQILAHAADYAHSRLVCEVHFPSDVVAGQTYGTVIAERLMEQPAFQAMFAKAASEMHDNGM